MTHTKDEALISLITELVGTVALYDMEKARRLGKRVHQALAAPAPVQEPAKRVCNLGCKNLGACCADPMCEAVATTTPAAPVQKQPQNCGTGYCSCIECVMEPAPVQVDAWPCVIDEADFEQDTITLKMQCSDYEVRAGQHWLHTNQPAAQPSQKAIEWPNARDVGRYGDMSPSAHLRVGLDTDNDVYLSVWDESGGASIEFCTPGAGGGDSPATRMALIALMLAIEQDNAQRPDKDWWAKRKASHERAIETAKKGNT